MPRYSVLLHGEHFSLPPEEEGDTSGAIVGFFTTRVLDARSPEQAVATAIEETRNEFRNRVSTEVEATVNVESVTEVSWWHRRFRRPVGFTFYGVDEDQPETGRDAE